MLTSQLQYFSFTLTLVMAPIRRGSDYTCDYKYITMRFFTLLLCTTLSISLSGQTLAKGDLAAALKSGNLAVEGIVTNTRIESAAVGIAGTKSEQYERFYTWYTEASDEDILRMTSHTSPVVRSYALWAMALKNHPDFQSTARSLGADDAEIDTVFGCVVERMTVADFAMRLRQGKILGTGTR